jgi:hypothetical protein
MLRTRAARTFAGARRVLATGVVGLAVAAAGLTACTDDGTDAGGGTTSTTLAPEAVPVDDPLAFATYTDPTTLIVAQVGERFAIVLPAEPTEGFRWEVVEGPNPDVVVSLGLQFVPRESVPTTTTTTTTPPPPPPDPGAPVDAPAVGTDVPVPPPAETAPPPPTEAPTTTVPTRAAQVLSYVARAPGSTAVTLRYLRVGAVADDSTTTVTFVMEVPVPA